MDESKKQLLSDIFWKMNSISSRSESHSETEITETDDGNGNIVQTETTVTKTTLYITVSHLTVEEMADLYGFNEEQREYLAELLKDKNNSLWAAVLYGIRYSEDQIVTVALSQVGNVGGEPYWSWYGFGSRVEWCACFVSWCAEQCGYIDTGVIPKYAGCVNGIQWFKDRGQWIDGAAEPVPGMIIFFDWDNKGSSGPQDGQSDHTGIVQKVENGIVYHAGQFKYGSTTPTREMLISAYKLNNVSSNIINLTWNRVYGSGGLGRNSRVLDYQKVNDDSQHKRTELLKKVGQRSTIPSLWNKPASTTSAYRLAASAECTMWTIFRLRRVDCPARRTLCRTVSCRGRTAGA